MPVGEVPITSYFTRVPPKKKRKENPHIHSAPAKRKRQNDDDEEQKVQPKKDKQQASLAFPKDSCKTAAVRPRAVGASSKRRASPSPPPKTRVSPRVSNDPIDLTDDDSPSVSSTSHTSPYTTPKLPQIGQGDKAAKSVAFASLPSVFSIHNNVNEASNPSWDAASIDDAPSPCFVPSSQTQDISSPNPHPSLPTPPEPFRLPVEPPYGLSQSEDTVPSSQSQYTLPTQCSPQLEVDTSGMDFVPSSQSQYMLPSPQLEVEASEINFVPSSQSQYFPPTPAAIQRDDDGFVVPSSQSQWLPPVRLDEEEASPAKGIICVPDDEIPSSQSQFELELKPRNHESVIQPPEAPPLPDLDIDITDIFDNPPVDVAPAVVEDDSATESDDDPPIVLPRIVEPVSPPSPEQGGYSIQSLYIGSLDDGGSSGSSAESLPADVKAFYDMVSGDGSYPDSFPESLKWTDNDTQD
ncbi:hypothetical protein DFH07DRAFT_800714 [Mycena maculata]|uniref:Uncharacterized protein n=1 Tax=Mycena maculata TaxID=230809 RepID=A0AAD7K0C8_9AGAR|nr:hypothetical protein DFH07DRAFT_800714 [Mycena maculata]